MSRLCFEEDGPDPLSKIGRISIGELNEPFWASLGTWDCSQYVKHWRAALERALNGEDALLLVDWCPTEADRGFSGQLWVIYWVAKSDCVLQNFLLGNEVFFEEGSQHVAEKLRIPPRETIDEEGEQVSEWRATRADLEEALAALL